MYVYAGIELENFSKMKEETMKVVIEKKKKNICF